MGSVVEEEIVKKNFGTPLKHSPDFTGPLKRRSCTDILCVLLFLAFIGGWIFIATIAYKTGDPERLIYPTDSLGRRCGVDELVKNKPHLFFFDLTKCASPTVLATGCPTPQVCVEKCPDTDFAASYYLASQKDLNLLKKQLICKYEVDLSNVRSFDDVKKLIDKNECAPWYIHSRPLSIFPGKVDPNTNQSMAGRCIPAPALQAGEEMVQLVINGQKYSKDNINANVVINATKTLAALASAEEVGEMLLQDLTGSWHLILLGLLESMLLCLGFILLMRWVAAPMIWLSLIGSMMLMSFCIYACYERYVSLKSVTASNLPNPSLGDIFTGNFKAYLAVKETWLVLGIIATVILVVVVLITLFLRSRLRIAVALIREASKAVGATTSSLFFPIVPWLLQIIVLSFGLAVMVYLASSGNPIYRVSGMSSGNCLCTSKTTVVYQDGFECSMEQFKQDCKDRLTGGVCLSASCSFYAYRSDTRINWFQAYNLLGLFWGLFFVSAFGEMVLAGTFATWYWTFNKEKVPYLTVTGALYRTIRYHLGTLAFGSLVIAICRMIRVFLEWLDHKLKKYSDNGFARGILCCCRCCFWCLEKFLKFMNRNAYIMCAVHGKNFCNSAQDAFFLLMRNIVRVVVLDKVTDFLLFLGKLLVVSAMCAQWFYIFSGRVAYINEHVPALNYYMVPVFVIAIGSYFIASVFFNVYAIAVDTLFLCFLEDSERNDGSEEKPYFMSRKLMAILSKKNK